MPIQNFFWPEAPSRTRLETIQILRGLAAMLVVYNHGALVALKGSPQGDPAFLAPSPEVAMLGAIGVDLFFVISGFVMALNARSFEGRTGALQFIALRFVRVAPLFYLFCLVQLGLLFLAGVEVSGRSILNSVFFLPLFDKNEYTWPIHYLGWTLAFEAIFYVIVATLIAANRGKDTGAILLAVISLPLLSYAIDDGLVLWKMITNPILWEFALGIIACKLWEARLLRRLRSLLIVAVALSVGVIVLIAGLGISFFAPIDTVLGNASAARSLIWGLPALAIVCLALSFGDIPSGPLSTGLRLIGDASYSIYLSHLFVVRVMEELLQRGMLGPDAALLGTLVCSTLVGAVVYRLAERPMLGIGRNWLRHLSLHVAAAQRRPI